MIFGDLGSYLDSNLVPVTPYEIMFKAGLQGMIFKGCQEALDQYISSSRSIAHARAAGIKSVGAYYWSDPTVSASYLRSRYKQAIESEKPDFISVDIEQRSDWSGKPIDPSIVSDRAQELTEGLASDFPELVMLPYSANYMVQYAPKLALWIDNFENWTAAWPDSPQQRYRLPLADIAKGMIRQTVYNANGPVRLPDGSYAYTNVYASDPTWNPKTSNKRCLIWQYSSRIMLPYDLVGGTQYDHQYDWNWINMTIEEWLDFTNKETKPMAAAIYKESVLQADRATIFTYRGDQSLKAGTTFKDVGADAFVLPMGGMDRYLNSQPTAYSEATFKGRLSAVHNAGYPVIGHFRMYPGYYGMRQYGDTTIKNQSCQPEMDDAQKQQGIRDNIALPFLLSSWSNDSFSMDKLFKRDMSWLPIEMLEIGVASLDGFKGVPVNDYWLSLTLKHVFQPLRWLMLRNYIPVVPMALYCGPWLLGQFSIDGETNTYLNNSKDWMYLRLAQLTQFNTRLFPTVKELWATRPSDAFRWMYGSNKWSPLDGYQQRVYGHEYVVASDDSSDPALSVADILDASGKPTKVSLSLAQSYVSDLYKLLSWAGAPVVVPPVEPPVVVPPPVVPPVIPGKITTLAEAITAIEDLMAWREKIRGA
jgi:hypothetical protein